MICTSFQKSVLWNLLQYQYKVISPICKWKITHWHVVGGATCRKKLGVKILSLPLQTCWFNLQTQFKLTHCLLHVHTVIVENNYRLHDIRRNKRYIGTYTKKKKKAHLLFNLFERWLVMMCSSDTNFTFLRLLFNSPNYCIYRRAVSLNTTHTFVTIKTL